MHPATLYGFLLALTGLVAIVVLVALGDVPAEVGVPIITGIAGTSVGAAAGVATPQKSSVQEIGTATMADAGE